MVFSLVGIWPCLLTDFRKDVLGTNTYLGHLPIWTNILVFVPGRPARDKHSSLFAALVNCKEKKFCNLVNRASTHICLHPQTKWSWLATETGVPRICLQEPGILFKTFHFFSKLITCHI
jgi:hypothetical protein